MSKVARDLSSEPPMVLGATGPNRTFQNGDVLYIDGGCTYSGYKMDLRPPRGLRRAFSASAIRA